MLLERLLDGVPDRRFEAVRQVLAQHSFHERTRLWLRLRAPPGAVRSRHRPEMEQMADAERRVVRRVVVGVGDEALLGDQERKALRRNLLGGLESGDLPVDELPGSPRLLVALERLPDARIALRMALDRYPPGEASSVLSALRVCESGVQLGDGHADRASVTALCRHGTEFRASPGARLRRGLRLADPRPARPRTRTMPVRLGVHHDDHPRGGERNDGLERRVDLDEPVGALVGVVYPLDVAPGSGADPAPLLGRRGELRDSFAEGLLRDQDDRHVGAECALGLLDGLGPEVAQNRLAESHRLDREDPVPAGIELVDDEVGAPVPAACLVVAQPFDDVELDVEALARFYQVLGALPTPAGRGVQDDRARALLRVRRVVLAQVQPGRDYLGVRDPAERVVRADDPGIRAAGVPELVRSLAADVGAEEVEHRLAPGRLEDRPGRLPRHECPAEVEVEDISLRQEAKEGWPLHRLASPEPRGPVERSVGLRVELLPLDDDELRVDALPAKRQHVRPRNARHVQRGVNYPGSSHSTWSK